MSESSYFKQLRIAYIEVTNKCNINCKYCYEVQKKQERQIFTVERFTRIIDLVARHSCQEQISVIFHGGEPLLASIDFYRECLGYAKKTLVAAGKTVDFGLQSNLMLLQDGLIPILRQYDVGISTSIDGPKEIHDQARSGWEQTVSNLKKLQDAGVRVNFIAVCSQHNHRRLPELFNLAKDLGFQSLQLNIASCVRNINPESPLQPLTASEIFDVYKQSLELWKQTGVEERNMELMLRRYLTPEWDVKHELYCESPFCYAGTYMLVFTPDGLMHMCSPAVPLAAQHPEFVAGNMDDMADDHRLKDALRAFHAKDEKYERECQCCEASCICNFGCPAFDRIDPVTAEAHCGAVKLFYDFLGRQDQQILKQLISSPHEPNTHR